jgi:hypothetical protein
MNGISGIYGVAAATAFDTRRNRILVVGGSNNESQAFTTWRPTPCKS